MSPTGPASATGPVRAVPLRPPAAVRAQAALPGMPASVPPPDVPLSFLAASGAGLIGAGVTVALVAGRLVGDPTGDRAIAAVHMVMLSFLTTGVLGAVHQFGCVVGRRSLRSARAARVSLALIVAGSWVLPAGFAAGANLVVAAAGALLGLGVLLAAWNLTGPLFGPARGVSIVGLRLSVAGLVTTAGFGVTYAFDRQAGEGWFALDPHVVLAHAHIGLIAWLGLTYVAVAEKLWPMFLLAHRPGRSPGDFAVWLIPPGVVGLVVGLMAGWRYVAVAASVVIAAGLAAHLASFAGLLLRHRRRPPDLLHAFIVGSAVFLLTAMALAAVAGLAPLDGAVRARLASAEIAAVAAWIGLALIGHAHKVVPFICWGVLRKRGVATTHAGQPLLFTHLWDRRAGRLTLATASGGFAAVTSGLIAASAAPVLAGGVLLAATGVIVSANLGLGPIRAARNQGEATA
ncbi:MAG TPA: hypothetical protein VFH58_16490 [Acidimicrobiales bacterium]|nr:hypothetical protein [Acidimicrobiales bacterium]